MRLMIASDIHGSAYYTEQLLNCFVSEKPDKLVLLGDLLYHGPRNPLPQDYNPQKVAALLNQYKNYIIAVKGNCDADIDRMLLEFDAHSEQVITILANRLIYFTHGDKYNLENPPLLNPQDILVNGHFHVQEVKATPRFIYLNPGSISLPKDNKRGYIILEDHRISFKTLAGVETSAFEI